jgi:25S rRNA (uracil2634-N3)-methyltransferase
MSERPPHRHQVDRPHQLYKMKAKLKKALNKYQQKQRTVIHKAPPMKIKATPQKSQRDIVKQRNWMCNLNDGNVLIVGDGNFSFSLSLARLMKQQDEFWPCKIYATSFDEEDVGRQKYGDLPSHIESLKKLGVHVAFAVDATKLSATLPKQWKGLLFSKIIFNHPHVGAGIKDQDRNVRTNQQLLVDFFKSASGHLVLPTTENLVLDLEDDAIPVVQGQIIVTLKQGKPYDLWDLKKLATSSSLVCLRSWIFQQEAFPGYEHRRTLGFKDSVSQGGNEELVGKAVRTHCFIVDSKQSQKAQAQYARWLKARSQKRIAANFHAGQDSDSD